jgi:Na+/H+-dicarboxylate symporter
MTVDWLSAAALAVVVALYAAILAVRRKKRGFTASVVGALVAGIGVGALFPGHTDWILPFGKIYVTVLGAIVIPLIAISILSSVTSLGSVKQLRGIGVRSVLWLLGTNLIAILLAVGLGLASGLGNGANLSIDEVDAEHFESATVSFQEVLIGFFPRNIVHDMANDHIIPVILFSVLIAVSYVLVANERAAQVAPFKKLVEAAKAIIHKAVGFIIELTPYAVLSLTAVQASRGLENAGIVLSLLRMLGVAFVAFAIDTWLVGGALLRAFTRVPVLAFFKKIVPAQVVGFSTQSSVGTLPVTTRVLTEEIGVGPEVANFTAPLGTTIGMPGCAGIWPILTAIYGVHGLGIDYGLKDYALLIVLGLFVSLGTAGVPGTATVVTASVLTAVGLPLEIMVLTIPISAIADTGRTATNITGAMIAATIVATEGKDLDLAVFRGEKKATAAQVADEAADGGPDDAGEPVVGSCPI